MGGRISHSLIYHFGKLIILSCRHLKKQLFFKKGGVVQKENSLVVLWLGLSAFLFGDQVQSLVGGTKISQAMWTHLC